MMEMCCRGCSCCGVEGGVGGYRILKRDEVIFGVGV